MHRVGLQSRCPQDQLHALTVLVEGVGPEPVEVDDGVLDHLDHRESGRCCVEGRLEAGEARVELAPRDVVLRRVVAKERPAPDAHRLGDVLGGRGVETVTSEQLERGALDRGVTRRGRASLGGSFGGGHSGKKYQAEWSCVMALSANTVTFLEPQALKGHSPWTRSRQALPPRRTPTRTSPSRRSSRTSRSTACAASTKP